MHWFMVILALFGIGTSAFAAGICAKKYTMERSVFWLLLFAWNGANAVWLLAMIFLLQ